MVFGFGKSPETPQPEPKGDQEPQRFPENKLNPPIEYGEGVEDYLKNNKDGVESETDILILHNQKIMGEHCRVLHVGPAQGETIRFEMEGKDGLKIISEKGGEVSTTTIRKGFLEVSGKSE